MRRLIGHTTMAITEAGIIALLILTLVVAPALAAKGGNGSGKGGGKPPKTHHNSSIALVMVDDVNGDGLPNWGDTVTFEPSTTATTQPYITLTCSQDGVVVYSAWAGFYPEYPWPGSQLMPLSSPSWLGGAAECTAVLNDGLATLRFIAAE